MSQVIKNKGRLLTALLIALIVVFAGIALAGRAVRADESGDGWTLSDDGTLTITSETAFQDKTWNADDVKKVVIADGVNKIGMTAFSNHTNLTSVDLGSCETIGYASFSGCTNLTSITPTSQVTSIDKFAFKNCSSLQSIDLSSIKTLGEAAFSASGVTEVILSYKINEIPPYAFDGCKSLTSINLENITYVDYRAFRGCSSLTSVDMRRIYMIESEAFSESALTSMAVGYKFMMYEEDSFPYENITSIYFFATKSFFEFYSPFFDLFPNATATYGGVYEIIYNLGYTDIYGMVEEGNKAKPYEYGPERDGYTFTGWYEDADCTVAFDFDKIITEDTVIYAGWERDKGFSGFTGYSISLDGDIGVNFYCVLPEGATDTDYIEFTVEDISGTQTVTVKNARTVTSEGVTEHVFKCHVPAKNMTSEITATLYIGGEVFAESTYSVVEYAEYILCHPEEYSAVIPLVRAMLNYGAYAQIYFDYYTDYLATDYIDNTGYSLDDADFERLYDSSTTNLPTGLTLQSASLILESNTDMKIFFKDETGKKLHFFLIVDNKETELTPVASGDLIYVRVTGIPAKKLDENFMIGIVAEGDETRYCFYYSPMMYAYNVVSRELTVTRSEELKDLMKAFYLYSEEALKYWGLK